VSASEFMIEASAKIIQDTNAISARLLNDWRQDRDRIPPGETWLQLRGFLTQLESGDGNVSIKHEVITVQAEVMHRLLVWDDERVYTEGNMLLDQAILIDPDFWNAMASVHEPVTNTALGISETSRVGHVVRYTFSAQLRLA
jgi:hypothetical protein